MAAPLTGSVLISARPSWRPIWTRASPCVHSWHPLIAACRARQPSVPESPRIREPRVRGRGVPLGYRGSTPWTGPRQLEPRTLGTAWRRPSPPLPAAVSVPPFASRSPVALAPSASATARNAGRRRGRLERGALRAAKSLHWRRSGTPQAFRAAERLGTTFCRTCGSPLPRFHPNGKIYFVPAGVLDDDPGVKIERHIFVGSKAPWDEIGGSALQFQEADPELRK